MGNFNDTKQSIIDTFTNFFGEYKWKFKVISYDTTDGINCLTLHGEDQDSNESELKFYGVQYISMRMNMGSSRFSLADWQDAQPIQWSLGSNAPPWCVCIEERRRGGSPAKSFIACDRIEVTSKDSKILATQKV